MATKRSRPTLRSAYSKVSATLETAVLKSIRQRSSNVSEFLNAAAKRKLYFDRLDEAIAELERRGVRGDPVQKERIRRALLGGRPSRLRR